MIDINDPKTDVKKLFEEFVKCDMNKNTWGVNGQGEFYFDDFSVITWLVTRRNSNGLISARYNSEDDRDAGVLISAWTQCNFIYNKKFGDDTYLMYCPVDSGYVEKVLVEGKNAFAEAMIKERRRYEKIS